MNADPRIALIGLGNAGQALLSALSMGFVVHVHDRDPDRYRNLSAVCRQTPVISGSASDAAREADIVILSLPSPMTSLAVAEEICSTIRPGTTVLETSTVRAEDVDALQECIACSGARVVDAAIVGGVDKLAKGEGVFLVGAEEADAGLLATVLRRMAAELFFLGSRGSGMRAKLVVNAVAHAVYVVLVEAGGLAVAQDIPLSVFYRLMERESGLTRPLKHRFGERLMAHEFAGGMSTVNARKDSGLILDTARTLGVPLFAIPAAHAVYELAMREGLGSLDYAAIGQLWEKWLGISFKQEP